MIHLRSCLDKLTVEAVGVVETEVVGVVVDAVLVVDGVVFAKQLVNS